MSARRKSIRMVEAFTLSPMPLASSSQMQAFTAAMRIDTPATRWLERASTFIAANKPRWDRIDALQAKCDAGTITAAEACELLKLEREA